MKTIEQKAKAYDETIEKLRDFYRDYNTISCLIDVKEELANLFPELKESEDEKIISTIRKALEAKVEDLGNGVTRTACLAWLEKQGEEARNIALRTEYEKGRADAIAEIQKPVSDDLMEAANGYAFDLDAGDLNTNRDTFIAGANWQKEQMMAKAVDGEVGYWNIRGLSINMELPSKLEDGDKVKLIIVKEG